MVKVRWLLLVLLTMAFVLASGDKPPRDIDKMTVKVGEEFQIKQFLPNPQRYPDDWYTYSVPRLSNHFVRYLGKEDKLNDQHTVFYFVAAGVGETAIDFIKSAGGKDSTDGVVSRITVVVDKK